VKLSDYFATARGTGVLSTADAQGQVNSAVYARPHFLAGDDTCAFIMSNRRSHENVRANPHAAYLFIEQGEGHVGKRLTLTLLSEEADAAKIKSLRRRTAPPFNPGEKFLVHFRIDAVRPLIGSDDAADQDE